MMVTVLSEQMEPVALSMNTYPTHLRNTFFKLKYYYTVRTNRTITLWNSNYSHSPDDRHYRP